jgi:hypothetical protein
MRILRGAALSSHGDSYLDRAQRVAELESELKLQRFIRDVPKYERAQTEHQLGEEDGEGEEVPRDSIDDTFFVGRFGRHGEEPELPYQPVMYKVVKNNEQKNEKESLQ